MNFRNLDPVYIKLGIESLGCRNFRLVILASDKRAAYGDVENREIIMFNESVIIEIIGFRKDRVSGRVYKRFRRIFIADVRFAVSDICILVNLDVIYIPCYRLISDLYGICMISGRVI